MIKVNQANYDAAQRRLAEGAWRVDEAVGILRADRDEIAGSLNTCGYRQLRFKMGAKQARVMAHRVMWEAVRGPIPVGMYVNHINGVKTDNAIANLELVTPKQNMAHAALTGLMDGNWKMKPADSRERVREIYTAAWAGLETAQQVADRFGVKVSRVKGIKSRLHCPQFTEDLTHLKRDLRIKYPDEIIVQIREQLAAGVPKREICAEFGMSRGNVQFIAKGARRRAA